MKNKGIKIIFMLTSMFIIFSAGAQDKHNPTTNAKKQTEWLKTELSLSNDQVSKVENVNLAYAKKQKEVRDEMRLQTKTLEEARQKELEAIFTKEQLEKYEAKKAEMKEKRKQGHMKGKQDCIKKTEEKK